jgi:hypothetical protein
MPQRTRHKAISPLHVPSRRIPICLDLESAKHVRNSEMQSCDRQIHANATPTAPAKTEHRFIAGAVCFSVAEPALGIES